MVLQILIFVFLYRRLDDKIFWIKQQHTVLECDLLLKQVCNSGLEFGIGHAGTGV
jgi:hypothetical protein